MRFDQYAGHCIVSNFRLHRDSHSQILIAREASSAPTLARSNLIRLSSLDWQSWLLLPAAPALSCHLLADHPVSLHMVDRHLWKLCPPVFPPKNGLIALLPSTNGAIPYFLVLPGSELSITEITEYTYFSSSKVCRVKVSKILYQWILLLNPIWFCET